MCTFPNLRKHTFTIKNIAFTQGKSNYLATNFIIIFDSKKHTFLFFAFYSLKYPQDQRHGFLIKNFIWKVLIFKNR